jgi:hypothetical protein
MWIIIISLDERTLYSRKINYLFKKVAIRLILSHFSPVFAFHFLIVSYGVCVTDDNGFGIRWIDLLDTHKS